jgi:hypothetical protein
VPEISGERPRSLADESVLIALVSEAEFPASREFSREFFEKWPSKTIFIQNPLATPEVYIEIPYSMEQGIFSMEQGILSAEQGFRGSRAGKHGKHGKRPFLPQLFCS